MRMIRSKSKLMILSCMAVIILYCGYDKVKRWHIGAVVENTRVIYLFRDFYDWKICYSTIDEELYFAIIIREPSGNAFPLVYNIDMRTGYAHMHYTTPSGSKKSIRKNMVYQYMGDKYSESHIVMDNRIFQDFINAHRPDYSISALYQYLESLESSPDEDS